MARKIFADNVYLLGRGPSLAALPRKSSRLFKWSVVTNCFDKEIRKTRKFFSGLNTIAVRSTKKANCVSKHTTYRTMNTKKIVVTNKLPEEMTQELSDYDAGLPTTGMVALAYIITMMNPKKIEIYGIDFNEGGYFDGHKMLVKGPPKQKKMKRFLEYIVKKYPKITFAFHTNTKIDVKAANLHFLTYDPPKPSKRTKAQKIKNRVKLKHKAYLNLKTSMGNYLKHVEDPNLKYMIKTIFARILKTHTRN